ncbi:MAG: FAD-dependent oxidoreductase [Pseudomonadota bacterium]
MKTHARIVVIGGGIAGCSALYHLTREGETDVVLVERDELTSGTTWHSAAQVTQFGAIQVMVGLKKHSVDLYTEMAADPDFPINYHITGGVRLAHTQDHLDGYHHFVGMAKAMGVDFEVIDAEETCRRHPLIQPEGLAGSLWDPRDGDIDPSQLTQAFARRARKAGAEVYRFNPVEAIDRAPSGEWIIHTKNGDITCEIFVNACGYRVNEVAAMYGMEHPVMSMEHQYFLTETIPLLAERLKENGWRVPIIRDPGDDFYARQERDGLLVGIYEQGCKTWGLDGIDPDFTNALCPNDLDRLLDNMEAVFERCPTLAEVGISRTINGPITYSADGLPLVGKIPGLENAYCIIGLRAGVGEGGGHGKILAETIVHGEAEWDAWALDPRRFTSHAGVNYTTLKAIEDYQNEFRFHMPHEHRPAGRPAKTNALYPILKEKGGHFGPLSGWERAMYYQPDADYQDIPSFRHTTWFEPVADEVKLVRGNVGVMDIAGFSRFELSGPDAADWLHRMITGRVPRVGRIGLGYFCNDRGHVVSEATISRVEEDRFILLCAAPAEWHDWDWFTQNAPAAGVTLTNLTASHQSLAIAGPNARKVLARLTHADLSNEAFPWLSVRPIRIGFCEAQALRVGFTGELGWEIHVPAEHLVSTFEHIMDAGQEFDIGLFGAYANESMRLEKCYRHWKADLITERTPLEAGLERFVRLDKPEFMGKAALVSQKEAGVPTRLVPMIVDCGIATAHAGDPLFHDDMLIGSVTSAGFGHSTGKNIAMGYVPTSLSTPGTMVDVSIIGERYRAEIVSEPIFDHNNERPRM